jgi:hypothetical protein
MKITIYAFLKFFEEEQHARAFVAGRLHLNPLSFFRDLAEASSARSDEIRLCTRTQTRAGTGRPSAHATLR